MSFLITLAFALGMLWLQHDNFFDVDLFFAWEFGSQIFRTVFLIWLLYRLEQRMGQQNAQYATIKAWMKILMDKERGKGD